MEILDIVDNKGSPTGETVARDKAHREGIQHRTTHVWAIREKENGYDVLLQKRSRGKDSYPGLYDTSSAGHVPAGQEPLPSALRELKEELGITAAPDQLEYIGWFHFRTDEVFHGQPFRDNEIIQVYIYREEVELKKLILQPSEVEEVRWFDLEEVYREIQNDHTRLCVDPDGFNVLREYLRRK